jgi:hypothetical protein
MTMTGNPGTGFWYQVERPFRALGRGIGRVLDALELLGLVLGTVRGVAWLFRSIGRAISGWF